jgi:uncharacterized protein
MTTPLADRLRAVFGTSLRGGQEPGVGSRSDACVAPLELGAAQESDSSTRPPLPGREIQTSAGPCLLYEERYPADLHHGGVSLHDCLSVPVETLTLLGRDLHGHKIDLREAVFLDTETTGLAGGTGTTAFLIGIGFFEAPTLDPPSATSPALPLSRSPALPLAFIIKQFFMRDFAEERAVLLALAEALAPFRYLVTFNGKSFDLPLLESRYTLARMRRWWAPAAHLDLLHPVRRVWKERLGSCSLSALEEAVLGHRRVGDVPSWMIPAVYSEFVRQGESGPLRRVFSHNREDLLSLAALASHLGQRLADPLAACLHPDELVAVARLLYDRGRRDQACACLEAALARAELNARTTCQALLASWCRRAGQRERALELWQELASGPAALPSLIELAKHHEHQSRDPAAALELVEQALTILDLREARDGPARWRVERADLERRLVRLMRKRGRL